MDNGELFKSSFRVEPAEEGGFIVDMVGAYDRRGPQFAFSNLDDMMSFFNRHADAAVRFVGNEKAGSTWTKPDDWTEKHLVETTGIGPMHGSGGGTISANDVNDSLRTITDWAKVSD